MPTIGSGVHELRIIHEGRYRVIYIEVCGCRRRPACVPPEENAEDDEARYRQSEAGAEGPSARGVNDGQ